MIKAQPLLKSYRQSGAWEQDKIQTWSMKTNEQKIQTK